MQISLSAGSLLALFGAMLVLALVPSVSVLAVSARAAASGFGQGAWTALGIVAGDVVFISAALLGLAVLAETLGEAFVLVRYVGGAWLIWLGIDLWRPRSETDDDGRPSGASRLSSFMAGLLLTLADQKAILFYLGFLPAFVDLSAISLLDAAFVMASMVVAVGGPKLGYAWVAAHGTGWLIETRLQRWLTRIAAGTLFGTGLFLIAGA